MRITTLLPAPLLLAAAFGQITDPVSGHTYQLINSNLSWTDANLAAPTHMFNGQPGHLATVTSQAELDFIVQNLSPGRPWLGGFHDSNAPGYQEPDLGWQWVTGEPFTFTNWFTGEPNNTSASGGPEDHLEMFGGGEWNDAEDNHLFTNQYLVEWGPINTSIGTIYCSPANVNSSGNPAAISAMGSVDVIDNNVTLSAVDLPANQFGMFVNSMSTGFVTPPGSQGNLCLSGQIGRHNQNILNSGATGEFSLALDLTNVPQPLGPVAIQAGETWHWQAWFRDLNPGSTSNFTDGIMITFQ